MIILDSITKSLELILSSTVATSELPWTASFVDITTTSFSPLSSDGNSTGTSPVVIVSAPLSNTQRQIKSLSIHNQDTAVAMVTVRLNNNSSRRNICIVELQPNETLMYIDTAGFYVSQYDGTIKTGNALQEVTAFNNRTGNVFLTSSDVTTALTYTPQAHSVQLSLLSNIASTGIYSITSNTSVATVTITGQTDQISVSNGNGVLGDPVIELAENTIFPGTGGITVPLGNTTQQPTPSVGGVRYNTDTGFMEFSELYPEGVEWKRHLQIDCIEDADLLTGFVDSTSTEISFDSSTRTISVVPTGANYEIYHLGSRITINSPRTCVIPDAEGLYYFYFDSSGNLQYQTTDFTGQQIRVAWLYWATTQKLAFSVVCIRHDMNMSFGTFQFIMNTTGPIISSGLSLTSYTTSGTGSLDSDAQISLTDGTLMVAALSVNITNSPTPSQDWQQILNGPAQIPLLRFTGAGYGYKETATTFPFKVGSTRAQYNLNTSGNWSMVDANEGYYIITYLMVNSGITEPVFGIVGDRQYASLEDLSINGGWDQYAERNGPIVSQFCRYVRPIAQLVFQTSSSYTNSCKARLVTVSDLSVLPPTGKQLSHDLLSGLQDDDHFQYTHNGISRVITAQHTFSPNTASTAAFTLGANAQGQLITGLNSDQLDGYRASYFQPGNVSLTSLSNISPTSTGLYVITGNGTSTTRSVTSTGSTITVTNGSGVGGNINIDLPTLGNTVSSSFSKISTDNYGRVTNTTTVTSTDITTALGYTPVNKAGDTMAGNLNLNNYSITNLGSPVNSSDAVTKSYVDGISTGINWGSPVQSSNLIGDASSPPGSPNTPDAYVIKTGGNTGAWASFAVGDIVQWQGSSWVKICSGAIGQYFIIDGLNTTTPTGAFTSYKNYIVEITGGTSSSWSYTFTAPVNNNAVLSINANSYSYGTSFTYSSSLSSWVPFSVGTGSTGGLGLYFSAGKLNVGTASSSRIVVNSTNIDLATTSVTPGTYTKLTVDSYGRASAGTSLSSSDVTTALTYTPQAINGNLTALSNTSTTGLYTITGNGTSATRSISVPAGMSITNPDGVSGNISISLAGELSAVQGLSTTGLTARTGTGTWATRSISVPAGMSVTNPDGVSGNISISLAGELSAVQGLSTTGIVTRTGSGAWSTRSFSGQSGQISITNGDLIAGNGTISLATSGVTPGTYTKLTVDSYGRANSGTSLSSSDVTTALGYSPNTITTITPTTGNLTITGNTFITGNATARHMNLGDSFSNSNIGNVWVAGTASGTTADRPINFVDTSAVMKIARIGGNPSIELQEWDANITTQIGYWDVVSISGVLTFRDRSNNGSVNCLSIAQTSGNITTGNITASNISATTVSSNFTGTLNDTAVVSGSTDAIILTPSPAISAYVVGQVFTFVATYANTTGSATVNISGLGAIPLQMGSVILPIGGLIAGNTYRLRIENNGSFYGRISPFDSVSSNGDTINGSLFFVNGSNVIGAPTGNTAQRPLTPQPGSLRYNTTISSLEYYSTSTQWEYLLDAYPGSGGILQTIFLGITPASGTSTIPLNNTVPTTSTGTQVWSNTITPTYTTSKISMSGAITVACSTTSRAIIACLFRGSTCIGVSMETIANSTGTSNLTFNIIDSPNTTSATTYSVRIGVSSAATWYVGQGTAAYFGGLLANNGVTLTEIS
jgi:hypothetical protein